MLAIVSDFERLVAAGESIAEAVRLAQPRRFSPGEVIYLSVRYAVAAQVLEDAASVLGWLVEDVLT